VKSGSGGALKTKTANALLKREEEREENKKSWGKQQEQTKFMENTPGRTERRVEEDETCSERIWWKREKRGEGVGGGSNGRS